MNRSQELVRLPLTNDECRARFRRVADVAGVHVDAEPIAARGPFGQELSIDIVALGDGRVSTRRADPVGLPVLLHAG